MIYCRTIIFGAAWGLVALVLGACQSTIVPLQPVGEEAVAAAQTQPATEPGGVGGPQAVRVVDPNQTTRFVYHATYDRVWRESLALFEKLGYRVDRQDYRLGVLTTLPLESPQIVEPWRRDQTDAVNALENTVNDQRRTIVGIKRQRQDAIADFLRDGQRSPIMQAGIGRLEMQRLGIVDRARHALLTQRSGQAIAGLA